MLSVQNQITFKGKTSQPNKKQSIQENTAPQQIADSLYNFSNYGIATLNINKKASAKKVAPYCKNTLNQTDINPIKTEEEYEKVLDRVMYFEKNDKVYGKAKISCPVLKTNIEDFPDVPKELFGILPYCGNYDVHDDINRFLSGRELTEMDTNTALDFTRILDYSLDKLDEKFGTYSGYVFRGGFFSPDVKQYYSASTTPEGTDQHLKNEDLSIIKTKRGHNIIAFQNKYDKDGYYQQETEILLPKDAEYKEITKDTKEIDDLKDALAYFYLKSLKKDLMLSEKIKNKIRVYEEI